MTLKKVFIYLLFFIIIFIINYYFCSLTMDEIWNYGFSYNISNGILPYRDFNMVTLPFNALLIGLLMKIFGTSLLVYHLIVAGLYSLFFYIMSKKIAISKLVLLIIYTITFYSYTYNQIIGFLLIMILIIENTNYKHKNLIIGLLIGYIMMTKANIGVFIFLVFFFKSNSKLKAFLYSSIIPTLILLHLIASNSLWQCIDYCLLGLKNFISIYYFIIPELLVITYIIYKIIKTKDKNYYYILIFQIICYPLCEFNHFVIAIFPLFFYLFMTVKNKKEIIITNIILLSLCIPVIAYINFSYQKYDNSFIGNRNYYGNGDLSKIDKYIKDHSNQTMFYLNSDAYFIRLNHNQKITKYDLILKGNMGNDDNKFIYEIDRICRQTNCRIILRTDEYNIPHTQLPQVYKDFILNNYYLCDENFVYCRKENSCPINKKIS